MTPLRVALSTFCLCPPFSQPAFSPLRSLRDAVAFPALLLALFFAVIFGIGAEGALLAIGLASAPAFARLVRTLSASVAGLDYIAAARIAGVSRFRLLTRHVLP